MAARRGAKKGTGDAAGAHPHPIGPALVVEDDPIVAMDLADALREGGADPVETCPTTECARIMLERLAPAVIVLDSRLEDRNDGWALAELASVMGPPAPQVIFATASPESIPPEIAQLGTVLAKPFSPRDLIAALSPRRHASHRHAAHRHEGLLGRLRGALGGDD